tara:strand:+ start:1040 stop:1486 length:447 start_codon:yes stop_codon:yes gene_type:complete
MTNQFQNTLAYTQLYSEGGTFTLDASGVKFPFTPTFLENKNFNVKPDFTFEVTQTGAYFVDFSFIAKGGASSSIDLIWYKNDQLLSLYKTSFYQQSTQQYEVSNNFIINLTQYDKMYPALLLTSGSGDEFSTLDIKLNSFNLQQLGIH